MSDGNLTHIILKTNKVAETLKFYETKFGIKNHAREGLAFRFDAFILGFDITENEVDSDAISHIGILYDSTDKIKSLHKVFDNPTDIIGGPGQGPYRYYLKDPNGYTLEIETFDGASDGLSKS